MKKYLFSAAAVILALVAQAAAKDLKKTLDLDGFTAISVSGIYDLDVKVGGDYSITLSGSAEELERVEAVVRGDTLDLGRQERKGIRWGGRNEKGVNVTITMPALTSLDVSGVVDGEISGVDSESLDLDISGVGDVELSGTCGRLDADVSGVGELNAKELKCRIVEVDVSGVGDASVYASEEVDAEVSGMGDIDVYGSPKKVRKGSGMFADVNVR